jgi:hypothetical protein
MGAGPPTEEGREGTENKIIHRSLISKKYLAGYGKQMGHVSPVYNEPVETLSAPCGIRKSLNPKGFCYFSQIKKNSNIKN